MKCVVCLLFLSHRREIKKHIAIRKPSREEAKVYLREKLDERCAKSEMNVNGFFVLLPPNIEGKSFFFLRNPPAQSPFPRPTETFKE